MAKLVIRSRFAASHSAAPQKCDIFPQAVPWKTGKRQGKLIKEKNHRAANGKYKYLFRGSGLVFASIKENKGTVQTFQEQFPFRGSEERDS